MKTDYNTSRKDNLTSAALLAATFIAIVGGIVTSNDAHAVKVAPQMEVQRMETIVVAASRITPIARMETIVVTASRNTNILLASN